MSLHRTFLLCMFVPLAFSCAADHVDVTGEESLRVAGGVEAPSSAHTLDTVLNELMGVRRYVLPPTGTPRAEVEAVFGEPTRYVTEGYKGPQPHYVYLLGSGPETEDVGLRVKYGEDGRTRLAWLYKTPGVHGRFMKPPAEQRIRELRDRIAMHRWIARAMRAALEQASWNRQPGSIQPGGSSRTRPVTPRAARSDRQ